MGNHNNSGPARQGSDGEREFLTAKEVAARLAPCSTRLVQANIKPTLVRGGIRRDTWGDVIAQMQPQTFLRKAKKD